MGDKNGCSCKDTTSVPRLIELASYRKHAIGTPCIHRGSVLLPMNMETMKTGNTKTQYSGRNFCSQSDWQYIGCFSPFLSQFETGCCGIGQASWFVPTSCLDPSELARIGLLILLLSSGVRCYTHLHTSGGWIDGQYHSPQLSSLHDLLDSNLLHTGPTYLHTDFLYSDLT